MNNLKIFGVLSAVSFIALTGLASSAVITAPSIPVADNVALSGLSSLTTTNVTRQAYLNTGGVYIPAPYTQYTPVTGTCSITSAVVTGSISGNTLTVSAVSSGAVRPGLPLNGDNIPAGEVILSDTTGTGGDGTYSLSKSLTNSISSETITFYGDGGAQIPTADGNCWTISPQIRYDPRTWGGRPGSTDSLLALQDMANYLASLNSPSATISLADQSYSVSCTLELPGNAAGTYIGGVSIEDGELLATSNFCAGFTAPAEPVPILSVEAGSYNARIKDLIIDGNFLASGLLVIPGVSGDRTYKAAVNNVRVQRYFNPAYANEAAYDPNYNTAYQRIYISLTYGGTRFQTGETISATSGGTATIYDVENNALLLNNVSGTFGASDTITGETSAATATLVTAVNGAIAGLNTVYLAPAASTNTYRPYGFRIGTLATASPTSESSQATFSNIDAKQFLPSDSQYTVEEDFTGIGLWVSALDTKVHHANIDGNRIGIVDDYWNNFFDNIHAFPIGFTSTQHEWTDIEVNEGSNVFTDTYLDHGQVMLNDPRNVFIGGIVANIASPHTPISAAFSLAVPSNCGEPPCNLGNFGPIKIEGFWQRNTGKGNNSGVPEFIKIWAPNGSGTSFTGAGPLEKTGLNVQVDSTPTTIYDVGNDYTSILRIISGGAAALSQYQDINTPSGEFAAFGSLGNAATIRSPGGGNIPIYEGSGSPESTITASSPALYFNEAGSEGTTLYVKESGTNTNTGWTAFGSVTWPTDGDLIISNGTSSPAGLAPVNNEIVYGTGGSWAALPSANSAVLVTSASGVPSLAATIPSGVATTGVTDGSNASTGNVGEYVSSNIASGSAVSLTNTTSANITSISLSAGDWDVNGICAMKDSSGLATENCAVNTTSATLPTLSDTAALVTEPISSSNLISLSLPPSRISLSATTTVYLVTQATFGSGSASAYGFISARRVR